MAGRSVADASATVTGVGEVEALASVWAAAAAFEMDSALDSASSRNKGRKSSRMT